MTENKQNDNNGKTMRVELFLARLLRWGVILSFLIIFIGISAFIFTGQTGYHQIHMDDVDSIVQYRTKPDFPDTLSDVLIGVYAFKPYAIITLGLLVLIVIPVVRVAVSVVVFIQEHDWLYVFITMFVLAMLILSFAIGEAGG